MPIELAAAIRSIRERSGQTQQDFADALSVTHSMVSKYEKGLATPGSNVLFQILLRAGGEDAAAEFDVIMRALADSLGTDLDGLQRILTRIYSQQQETAAWRSAVKRTSSGDEALERALADPRIQAVIAYWLDFGDDPDMAIHLTEAVSLLAVHRAHREELDLARLKIPDLSQKELQRLENLLYFIRHADADEVDEVVRRAAVFRRFKERERKHTPETKQARGRR